VLRVAAPPRNGRFGADATSLRQNPERWRYAVLLTTTWRIRLHIKRDILEGRAKTRDPLAAQELDSLDLEQLVSFLEERFGVSFQDDELVAENFASINVLAQFVEKKRKARKETRALARVG
jgi:acyl carrier protein